MKVLVTGATGHVGANVVAHLNRAGIRPRVLLRKTSRTVAIDDLDYDPFYGDVTEPYAVSEAAKGMEVVYHVAALVRFLGRDFEAMRRVNVDGTRNVIRACLDRGVGRLVHTSSVAAVGHAPSRDQPIDERADWNFPASLGYAFSKHLSEMAVREAVAVEKLSAVIVNPALVFGERDVNLNAGKMLVQIKKGNLPVASSGTQAVCDVDDVAAAHLAAAERGKDGERYIVSTQSMAYKALFEQIAACVGGRAPSIVMPAAVVRSAGWFVEKFVAPFLKKEPALTWEIGMQGTLYSTFDGSKLTRELGVVYTPFEQTLEKTKRWLEANGHLG